MGRPLTSGKTIHAWAVEGDGDPTGITSNTVSIEWPPRSGTVRAFPEIDRAAWFALDDARERITKGSSTPLRTSSTNSFSNWKKFSFGEGIAGVLTQEAADILQPAQGGAARRATAPYLVNRRPGHEFFLRHTFRVSLQLLSGQPGIHASGGIIETCRVPARS